MCYFNKTAMSIDKKYWKNIIFKDSKYPEILCPVCNKGQIIPIKESFCHEETSDTSFDKANEDWSPEFIEFRFSMMLKCSYNKCQDIVVCIGTGHNEHDMENDPTFGWIDVFTPIYTPKYFIPSLHLIHIKDRFPLELTKELKISFSHFFSDLSSCANKIRVCIEILMDCFCIKKTEIIKRKRRKLSLHSRILEYKKTNPEIAEYLLAIKWIGNPGSHFDQLSIDDVLDAYDILDFSLNKLYDLQEKTIKKLTKEINKKKAPLSKKRKSST
jgi:hypothetical protein